MKLEKVKPLQSCGNNRVCCEREFNLRQDSCNCGYRNEGGLADFGNAPTGKAQFAEFPSIVSIEGNNGRICTGSLISDRAVVAPASCVRNVDIRTLRVRLGAWQMSSKLGLQTEEVRRVTRGVYNTARGSLISILILSAAVDRTMFIGTSCLASSSDKLNTTDCVVVGWSDREPTGSHVNVQNVQLQTGPKNDQNMLASDPRTMGLGSAMMCRIMNTGENSFYQQIGIKTNGNDATTVEFADLISQKGWIDAQLRHQRINSRLNEYQTFQPFFIRRLARRIRNVAQAVVRNIRTVVAVVDAIVTVIVIVGLVVG